MTVQQKTLTALYLIATLLLPATSQADYRQLTDTDPARGGASFTDAAEWIGVYYRVEGWLEFVTDETQAFIHGALIEGELESGSPDPTLVSRIQILCSDGWRNVDFAPANGAALTFSVQVTCGDDDFLPRQARATFWYGCWGPDDRDPRPVGDPPAATVCD